MPSQEPLPDLDPRPLPPAQGLARLRLLAGTLARLGLPALLRYGRFRAGSRRALAADAPIPAPPFLWPEAAPAAPIIEWSPGVPAGDRAAAALAVPTAGSFDIRRVWEAGRLVDLPALAARDGAAAEAVVRSFLLANPPFRGPHWACGQEAAIRLAHLLAAGRAIGGAMLPGLKALVRLHRDRIQTTLDYAIAQDNNHAISEAAGLWAASLVLGEAAGAARGRRLLGRAVLRLFAPSGAFSQHSMRYQLVALEMAAFAQRIARDHGAAGLEEAAMARLGAGLAWLWRVSDPASGRAWRVGHDDSSRFFGAPPDDLGPALARLAAAFGPPPAPGPPFWLDAEGGFAGLCVGPLRAFLRLPINRFRPAQADALHLDLWCRGSCLSGDAGSYLYNANADPAGPDLARTALHNTVAFDEDDQMPHLSRFLYGAWLRPDAIAAAPGTISAAYTDHRGRRHARTVLLADGMLEVGDRVSGSFSRAVLRWRLPEAAWRLDGKRLCGGPFAMTVDGAEALRLVRLPFAPCYGALASQPVLEAVIGRTREATSRFTLAPAPGSA